MKRVSTGVSRVLASCNAKLTLGSVFPSSIRFIVIYEHGISFASPYLVSPF